jgi:hypothetical protein
MNLPLPSSWRKTAGENPYSKADTPIVPLLGEVEGRFQFLLLWAFVQTATLIG